MCRSDGGTAGGVPGVGAAWRSAGLLADGRAARVAPFSISVRSHGGRWNRAGAARPAGGRDGLGAEPSLEPTSVLPVIGELPGIEQRRHRALLVSACSRAKDERGSNFGGWKDAGRLRWQSWSALVFQSLMREKLPARYKQLHQLHWLGGNVEGSPLCAVSWGLLLFQDCSSLGEQKYLWSPRNTSLERCGDGVPAGTSSWHGRPLHCLLSRRASAVCVVSRA